MTVHARSIKPLGQVAASVPVLKKEKQGISNSSKARNMFLAL
jgi:hypothetical protein